jgi:hypothetical protein
VPTPLPGPPRGGCSVGEVEGTGKVRGGRHWGAGLPEIVACGQILRDCMGSWARSRRYAEHLGCLALSRGTSVSNGSSSLPFHSCHGPVDARTTGFSSVQRMRTFVPYSAFASNVGAVGEHQHER